MASIGGGIIGCETALWLARQGKKVVLIEAQQEMMFDSFPVIKSLMARMLTEASVTVMTGTQILEVIDGGLIIENSKGRQDIETDSITLAVGFKPNALLTDGLKKNRLSVNAIGDCVAPRNVKSAIWEAFRLARRI